MLSEREIEKLSETLTAGNRGYTEKLYLQDIVLGTVSRETTDELVFKGGTALMKFYQLDRFSEDLDFTARNQIDFERLVKKTVRDLENYGANVDERNDEANSKAFKTRLAVQGPLYTGDRRSLNFIRIEINRESSVSEFDNLRHNPRFRDLTSFELTVLTEAEILAEKIRAVLTRKKPRDLYDIHHLLSRGVEIEPDLVKSKLDYYSISYSPEEVLREAEKLERSWDRLETLIHSRKPGIDKVLVELEEALPES